MARIRDFAVTELGSTTAASLVCNMPVHVAGDVLIYFASKDGAVAINATADWGAIQDGLTAGCGYRAMFKAAASAAETLTVGTGTAENWCVVVIAVDGADGSSLANLIADSGGATAESAADDTAMPFDGPSVGTNTDANCLVLHAWFSDSGLSPTAYAPLVNIYAGDSGVNSVGLAYTYQRAAGAVAAGSWFGRANDDGRGIVLAIKDASSDAKVPGYSDPAVSAGQVLRPMVGLSTTFSDSWPVSLTLPTIGDDFDYVQRDAGGTFTDYTAACNDTTAADVTFPTAVGHHMYFGGADKFQAIIVNVATAGVTGVLVWEIWNGSAWSSTGVTGANLTATGQTLITLSPVAVAAMATTTINSQTFYWLRGRVSTAYTVAPILTQGRKGGRTATYITAGASLDNGTNPYTDAASNIGSSTTTTLAGCQHTYGAALDLDTGILFGSFRAALRRDLDIDPALPMPNSNPGGLQVTFADTSNNYLSYIVHARGALSTDPDGRNVFAIDWNGAATEWAKRGAINKSAVTYSIWTSLAYAGAVSVVWSMLSLVTRIAIAGGSSSEPLDFDDVQQVANNCVGMFPFVQRSGSAATLNAPMQFGGGDKICLAVDKLTIQFPRRYDGVEYFAWNAGDNVAGVKFYPKSGDVIKFTNCLFTSPSAYRWEFDASMASSGWTMDFSGTTIVGATVTLRAASDLDGVTFIDCPTFTQNAASLTNCAFDNTKVSCAAPADATLISDCSFVSGGTGHAIEIGGTVATVTLTDVFFTGYSGTGTDAPIYVNIATGSMTINIVGGTTPTIRTAGATVTVVNAKTAKVTVKAASDSAAIQNARVLLLADTGGDLPVNETVTIANSGTAATVTHTAHGLSSGQKVQIKGASHAANNGVFAVTVTNANEYTYTMGSAPGSNPTGTILATGVILEGLTDASGIIQNAAFPYTADQPVVGRARKSTSAPFYKTGGVSGTLTTAGFDTTVFLVRDE